ncbi:unnamed protein product [Caenorhabditis auriculariae]|uniref:Uncharacterized protein n=1 Tax=Caenorhabditis auriculariae TaxID=2777116 RepID=A0A8S1GPC4_9PELO|nr:unnamed protein product [Caenorhabditis auriculariae]
MHRGRPDAEAAAHAGQRRRRKCEMASAAQPPPHVSSFCVCSSLPHPRKFRTLLCQLLLVFCCLPRPLLKLFPFCLAS